MNKCSICYSSQHDISYLKVNDHNIRTGSRRRNEKLEYFRQPGGSLDAFDVNLFTLFQSSSFVNEQLVLMIRTYMTV